MAKLPLIFMGSPGVAVTILEILLQAGHEIRAVISPPDKPAGRGQKLTSPPVKIFAEKNNLKVLQPRGVKTHEFVKELESLGAKALIIAAYGKILSQEILDLTPYPLNVHFSLLPKYRGASCVASALLNDEAETGVTIMKVVEELDAGPILSQRSLKILEEDTTGSLEEKLAPMGGNLLLETLEGLQYGKITAQEQDAKKASYAPLLKKEDGQIDWHKPARFIFNQIRAFNPWPIAHTFIDKKRLKIYGAQALTSGAHRAPQNPGTLLAFHKAGIEVACGEGKILITEIQGEGKNKMKAVDFLKGSGQDLQIGKRLGHSTVIG